MRLLGKEQWKGVDEQHQDFLWEFFRGNLPQSIEFFAKQLDQRSNTGVIQVTSVDEMKVLVTISGIWFARVPRGPSSIPFPVHEERFVPQAKQM